MPYAVMILCRSYRPLAPRLLRRRALRWHRPPGLLRWRAPTLASGEGIQIGQPAGGTAGVMVRAPSGGGAAGILLAAADAACCCGAPCADCNPAADTLTVTVADWVSIVGQTGPPGDPDAGNFVAPGCLRAGGITRTYGNWNIDSGDLNGTRTLNRYTDDLGSGCFTLGVPIPACVYYAVVPVAATLWEDDSFFSSCGDAELEHSYTQSIMEARRLCQNTGGGNVFYWRVRAYLDFDGTSLPQSPTVQLFEGDDLASPGDCTGTTISNVGHAFLGGGYFGLGRDGTATVTMP